MAERGFVWPLVNPPAAVQQVLGEGVTVKSVVDYKWIVILGGFLAFAMAWGIGANDVANAFATSVGAGSLTLRWACVIAAVMEFLGALLMGSNVTDTVRKKIIDPALFDPTKGGAANGPEILMTAFLVALISATSWLILATYFGLPVSTTHSIIGSLIGVGLTYRGAEAVIWWSDGAGLDRLKGAIGVVLSWIISPVLSGVFAVIVFLLVRTTVLRSKNPVRNGFIFLPLFYALAVAVVLFFIIYKGSPKFKLDKKFNVGQAIAISIGSGAGIALLAWWLLIPQAKRFIDRWEAREIQRLKNPEEIEHGPDKVNTALGKVGINLEIDEKLSDDVIRMHDNVEKFDPKAEQLFTWLQVFTAAFDAFAHGANDVANSIGPFASIFELYSSTGELSVGATTKAKADGKFVRGPRGAKGETFKKDDKLPTGSAWCGKANDKNYYRCKIQEARKPKPDFAFPYLSGVPSGETARKFHLYKYDDKADKTQATYIGEQDCYQNCNPGNLVKYSGKKQDVELWILALGGLGIVLGLAMWGYRIIVAIGVKLTKLTPSRGFSIEIGAAITVIIASRIGLPVSTTHCQVGATMGVGLVEFKGNTVNWKQFLYICAGWVFTVIFTGLLASAIFAVLINTPQEFAALQPKLPVHCPGQNLFYYDAEQQKFRGISCAAI